MELSAGQYYYSPRHIARDFVSTVAPFTFFIVLAVLGLPWLRHAVFRSLERLEPELSWTLVAVVVAAYVCVAYVSGAVANRIFLIPRFFSMAFSDRFEYAQYYPANSAAIEEWYRRYVPDWGVLAIEAEGKLQQKVDQLVWFFQLTNPSGFLHVYREYAFLFMYRQAFVYSCILGVPAAVASVWWLLALIVVIGVSAVIAVAAGIRDAVGSEFNFITATGSWLEMKRRAAALQQE